MTFFKETWAIIRHIALPAFFLLAASTWIDQLLASFLEASLRAESGQLQRLMIAAGFSMLNGLIFPPLILSLFLYSLLKIRKIETNFTSFASRCLEQIYIESLRAWGSTLLWGLLFIFPAFIRMFQLTLVPFVVAISKSYERGEVDALQTSSKLVSKAWLKIGLLLTGFHFVIPVLESIFFDSWRSFLETPVSAAFLVILDLFFFIILTQILFRLFIKIWPEDETLQVLATESRI